MAVEAQSPFDAFSPDFRSGRSPNDLFEELKMLQFRSHHIGDLVGAYDQIINNGATVLSDPQSELTCNAGASGSRKRTRHDALSSIPQVFNYSNLVAFPAKDSAISMPQISYEQNRMYGSAGTSTSGRPSDPSPFVSPPSQDLVSHFYQQRMEIDSLLRLQSERLRSELEYVRKRQRRELVSAMEQQVVKRISEKEAELQSAARRTAELEDMVRQASIEKQIWFDVANKNEAIASNLRTTLEQYLVQNSISTGVPPAEEGYGDSDDGAAHSCCFEEAAEERVAGASAVRREDVRWLRGCCRVCQEEEVCVLLLPCRHLCLCKDCDSRLDTCPICHSTKNASIQIFMS